MYLLLVLLAAVLGIGWALQAREAAREVARLAELTQASAALRADVYLQLRAATRVELTEQQDSLAQYARLAEDISARFSVLRTLAAGPSEAVAVDYLSQTYDTLAKDMQRISSTPFETQVQRRQMRLLDPPWERWMLDEFESAQRVLREVLERERQALAEAADRRDRRGVVIIALPLVVGIALWFVMRRRFGRRFIEPMRALSERAARLSAGDFSPSPPASSAVAEVVEVERALAGASAEVLRGREQLVLRERDAALGALVPVVAHNVRNPLASIRATAQLLEPGAPDDELAEARAGIIESVDRLERWTTALLRYLHPDRAPPAAVTLSPLLRSASESLSGRFAAEGVALQLELPADGASGEQHVEGDGPLLEQALSGLIANALDASPAASTVRVHVISGGDGYALCVDDEGPGLDYAPRVDVSGASAAAALAPGPSTKQFGTGLGLPFAANVARSHGGHLDVRRRSTIGAGGAGTRAALHLPAVAARPRATAPEAPPEVSRPAGSSAQ